jgi:hypothetical protein
LFAGVVIWGFLFPSRALPGDGKTYVGDPDRGGSPAAFSVESAMESGVAGAGMIGQPAIAEPLAGPLAALPALPDLPVSAVSEPLLATAPLPMAALPQAQAIAPPNMPLPAQVTDRVAASNTAVPAAGGAGRGNPLASNVAMGGFGDESVFGPGGAIGNGRGRGMGNGVGNGIDRGPSAASRPVVILNARDIDRDFSLPLKYQLKVPEKPVLMRIEVRADGSVAEVTITGSCGDAEVDDLVREYTRLYMRLSPAYENGKAIPSTIDYGRSFRPFN